MNDLPRGWGRVSIRDVVDEYETIDPRRTPEEKYLYVDIGAIDNTTQKIASHKVFLGGDAPSRARRIIKTNDVLFSTVRTYLRNVAQVPPELDGQLTSTGICVLRANAATDANFLFRWTCSKDFITEVSQAQDGTLYPAVRDEDVLSGPIPLPPLPEQRRIVQKLDTLSARTTSARTHLTAIEKLVERYKAVVVERVLEQVEATCGLATLAQACQSITDGDHQAPPKAERGIPFITISAINTGEIDLSKATRFVPVNYYKGLKHDRRPQAGDVLYSVTGSIGIPAPVVTNDAFVFQRHIAILRPDPQKIESGYLHLVLSSPQAYRQALSCATGIAQMTVPLRGLRAFEFPLPQLDRQREVVSQVKSLFAKAERVATEAARALELANCLDERTLEKAFMGQLVAQDPRDEPAEILLERIRAKQQKQPKARRGRRAKEVV